MAQIAGRTKEVKTISSSGQISLGKAHAGETVQIEVNENGQWIISPVKVIPKHLEWAFTAEVDSRLERFENRLENRSLIDLDITKLESKPRTLSGKSR